MELSPAGLLPPSWYQSWVLFQSLFFPNQGIERDRRAQAPSNLEEFEVNDLNYEDKLQEDRFLYSSIAFNLAADAGEGSQPCVWHRHLGGFLSVYITNATSVPQAGFVLDMWGSEEEGRHKGTVWYEDGQVGKVVTFFRFAAQSKCLDQALTLWKEVLTKGRAPAVRCLQQTAASLQILAAVYQLVAKVMGWLDGMALPQG